MTGLRTFFRLPILLMFLLTLAGCTGVGIFAVVAVSEKIEEGLLPEGLSATRVIASSGVDADLLFFSSGPALWYKNPTLPSPGDRWQARSIITAEGAWDGIQAVAATDNRIFLALYRVVNGNYEAAMYALTAFTGATTDFDSLDVSWTSDSSGYSTIRMFTPDPAGPVYVNVLEHSGTYGSLDSEDNGFLNSSLYTLPAGAGDWTGDAAIVAGAEPQLNGSIGRYVTGVADNGVGTIRITATSNLFSESNGIVMEGDGTLVDNPYIADPDGTISLGDGVYSTVSITGTTWVDRSWTGTGGAFLTAGTRTYDGVFPVFASKDGTNWVRLPGTNTEYLTVNFIDVGFTDAGDSDGKRLVLAGTSSYIDGSTSRIASGYNEIDVSTYDDPLGWSVSTDWDDYDLALNTNYSVSDLSRATITGMAIHGDYLYASTRNEGVWRLYLNEDYPSWTRE